MFSFRNSILSKTGYKVFVFVKDTVIHISRREQYLRTGIYLAIAIQTIKVWHAPK